MKNIYKGIEKKIVRLVGKSKFKNKIIYKSFSTEVLERFKSYQVNEELLYVTIGPIPLFSWIIIDDWLRFGSLYEIDGVNYIQVHRLLMTSTIISTAHEKGKKVIAWGVNSRDDMIKMIKMGVDLIETDYPDKLKKINLN